MDVGVVQTSADPLIEALVNEKKQLEALLDGYAVARSRLTKVDNCLASLTGVTLRRRYRKAGRVPGGQETIVDAVDRILRDSVSGMTVQQIDEELRKTHPAVAPNAVYRVLSKMRTERKYLHTGTNWSLNTIGSAA